LAQCQFKVTGWGIMFICGMVLRCAGTIKPGLSQAGPVTADLTTTVVNSYKLLINVVNTRSLTQSSYNCDDNWILKLNFFFYLYCSVKLK